VAAAVLRPGALAGAALPTALLAVVCQLARDGYRLMAPQGAAAGMVRGLATGNVSVTAFAAWVEDRAVAE
jgi:prophage maintenance system killer protein